MAKKRPNIQLEGLDKINFNTELDIKSAQSIIQPKEEIPTQKEVSSQKSSTTRRKKQSTTLEKKGKGTFPPPNKKRASFNIDANLHKALKDYSYFEEIEMVEYVFEQLVKPDLIKKGFYPPKKRER